MMIGGLGSSGAVNIAEMKPQQSAAGQVNAEAINVGGSGQVGSSVTESNILSDGTLEYIMFNFMTDDTNEDKGKSIFAAIEIYNAMNSLQQSASLSGISSGGEGAAAGGAAGAIGGASGIMAR